MKTPTLLLSLTLSLVAGGCIDTKDVGVESDASSGGSTSAGASESKSTSGSTAELDGSGTASMTAATASTGAVDLSTTGSDSGGSTGAGMTSIQGSDASTQGDTETFAEQPQCEDSGGFWDETSCGHYTCGLAPECAAIVPGCDCGAGSTFVEGGGGGCQPSEECDAVEFACGPELTCSAPSEFCDVFFPGVKGADTTYGCEPTSDTCSEAYTCACLNADIAGDCEEGATGGITISLAGA